jgi:hypothetical protein
MERTHNNKPSLSILDYVLEFFALLFVLVSIVLFVIYWNKLPEIVPIHYNIYGVADRFGSKTTLIVFPIISILTYIGLTFLNRYPHIFNYPTIITENNRLILYKAATQMIRWIKLFICLLFTDILWHGTRLINNFEYKLDNVFLFIIIAGIVLCPIFYITIIIKIGKRIN